MDRPNRRIVLSKQPRGMFEASDFRMEQSSLPKLQANDVLVRVRMLSCDVTQLGWLTGVRTPRVTCGDVMPAFGLGEVEASRHPDYRVGERVWGTLAWQDYVCVQPDKNAAIELPLRKVPAELRGTRILGAAGITGVTAYLGMVDVGRVAAGDTVVVSAAAGATGSIAAQLAKMRGARVIGIAGSPDKCRFLLEDLKLDGAIDYKHDDVHTALLAACPNGVDVYFDNVGGSLLDTLLLFMAVHGRIVCCGAVSRTPDLAQQAALNNYFMLIFRRVSMHGMLMSDHPDRFAPISRHLNTLIDDGQLVARETIVEGLEQAPVALRGLFEGHNLGKQLVRV